MNPTSPCRRSAACSVATCRARAHWPSSASACPPVSTTAPSNSRNGTPCAPDGLRLRHPGRLGDGTDRRRLCRTGRPPTGLTDPVCIVRPVGTQVDDLIAECSEVTAAGSRVLVTTLTKRMSEDLTEYMHEAGIAGPLHAFGYRDAGADRDPARSAAWRFRYPDRHQPAARRARYPRMRAGRHSRCRQGRVICAPRHRWCRPSDAPPATSMAG